MSWWCGFACGVTVILIVVTLVAWIVDESAEMQNLDDAQEKRKQKPMTQRTCETCRWWNRHTGLPTGDCQRLTPNSSTSKWPCTDEADFCGEWADAKLTAEQAERQELTMRFALAIVQGLYANPEGDMVDVMTESHRLANELLTQKEGQQ